jgi:thiol-disulfide isomerase/thioredoxin
MIVLFSASAGNSSEKPGHKIEVNINGLRDTTLILGHYYNQRMYVDDTTRIDQSGKAVFRGDEKLPGGIYVVYLPNQRYFDLLIDKDQRFQVSVDTANFVSTMEIKGAEQPRKFNHYQRFITQRQARAKQIQRQMKQAGPNTQKGQELQARLQELNQEVQNQWDKVIEENPGTMLALFLKGIRDIDVPDFEVSEQTKNPDSLRQAKRYRYYREHYFDNMDLTDARILRTPFFARKVENYVSNILPQIPDTLIREGTQLIEKSRPSEEVFRFMVQFLFNYANESQIMGMDKMVVRLAEKYYLSGEADWADQEFLSNLEERVQELKPTLIGKKGHDLKMKSSTGQFHRLHEINAPVTILVFWETDCGHCKKVIPKLHNLYQQKLQDQGVEIFAVYTQGNQKEWNQFIEEHELFDFINVWDPYRQSEFHKHYDVQSTPTIFVLDKEKTIIGKKIAVEDIPDFTQHYLNRGKIDRTNN